MHAVVRCSHLVEGVFESVRSVRTGSVVARTGAIVAAPTTPIAADEWLRAFAASHGFDFIRVVSDAPGVSWNAGLACAPGDAFAICLESGDTLGREALGHMYDALGSARGSTVATPGIEWVGPVNARAFSEPHGMTPAALLAHTQDVHVSSLFKRDAWSEARGFDTQLLALEHADFWLHLCRAGFTGVPVPAAVLRRRVHPRALYKAAWGTPDFHRAASVVFARHADAANPADILEEKERQVQRSFARRNALQGRTAALTQERHLLEAEHRDSLARGADVTLDLGSLRRTSPLAHDWGYSRGTPADRPLIERFLAAHRDDIRGRVLEVQEGDYTRRFGGPKVTHSDILDVSTDNTRATLYADLRSAASIPDDQFDCIILTQTLHVIDDMDAVVSECRRILKPGGTLLATVPCSSRVCVEYGPDGDYWRATESGVRACATRIFSSPYVDTISIGNALVNAAFTFGIAGEELPRETWTRDDPFFPSLVGLRARKMPASTSPPLRHGSERRAMGIVLMYHRVSDPGLDPFGLCVSPGRFRSQLEWLQSVGTIVPLAQLAAHEATGTSPQFALTFDDGYVDNLTNAAPALAEARIPATFFLTTGAGLEPYRYWWDRLSLLLAGSGPSTLTLDLPSGTVRFPMGSANERRDSFDRIYDTIVGLPAEERDRVVDAAVVSGATGTLDATTRRMTWDEARTLAAHPLFEIGCHTVHHLLLPRHAASVVERELLESRLRLERELSRPVTSLAYPFGAFDATAVTLAQAAGFRIAVTCEPRAVTRLDDPLECPRLGVADTPLETFVETIERLVGQRVR